MHRTFLRAKLHGARITTADPNYEGSISIDRALCRAASLLEFEQVDVYDVTNGVRFSTYVIYGEPGQVQVNGAAAQLVRPHDRIIIAAYIRLQPEEIGQHQPQIVQLDAENHIITSRAATISEP